MRISEDIITAEYIADFADLIENEIETRWSEGRALPLDMPIIAHARVLFGLDLWQAKEVHDVLIE